MPDSTDDKSTVYYDKPFYGNRFYRDTSHPGHNNEASTTNVDEAVEIYEEGEDQDKALRFLKRVENAGATSQDIGEHVLEKAIEKEMRQGRRPIASLLIGDENATLLNDTWLNTKNHIWEMAIDLSGAFDGLVNAVTAEFQEQAENLFTFGRDQDSPTQEPNQGPGLD